MPGPGSQDLTPSPRQRSGRVREHRRATPTEKGLEGISECSAVRWERHLSVSACDELGGVKSFLSQD